MATLYQETSYLLHEVEYWKWLIEHGYIKDFIKAAKETIDKVAAEVQA